jgi:hypothetical protein
MTESTAPAWIRLWTRGTGCAAILIAVATTEIPAQSADSARVAPRPVRTDTLPFEVKPPLSPRRAFLYSLLVPGLGQSRLQRPLAGAIFVFTESMAIAMLRESLAEVRQARRFRTDSLVVIGNDPITGEIVREPSPFGDGLVRTRQGHVEDWIAFLAANHLFAGADAYVAAHLWDLPAQIKVSQSSSGTVIAARLRW